MRGRNHEIALILRGVIFTDALQAFHFLQDFFHRCQDNSPRLRQRTNPFAVTCEDLDPEFILQLDDRLRYPRLRRKQRFSGFGEVVVLPDGFAHETELVQIHI